MRGFIKSLAQKKGAMEIEEIVKLIIAVTIFVIMAAGIAYLLSGRGSEVLETIRNALRFGR